MESLIVHSNRKGFRRNLCVTSVLELCVCVCAKDEYIYNVQMMYGSLASGMYIMYVLSTSLVAEIQRKFGQ